MASHLTDRRYAHSRALLGTDLFNKVADAKLLVVGQVSSTPRLDWGATVHPDCPPPTPRSAGGIGCELIKNLG